MKTFSLLASALFAAAVLAACGPSAQTPASPGEGGAAGSALPNSLSDTSEHVARRAIPSYGPSSGPGVADSVRRNAGVRGQVLYVPVYSHIFHRDENREFNLTATLSIRNTSPSESIRIREVDYFDSEGTLLQSYLRGAPRRLGPLASTFVVIAEGDRSGGVGANFIVEWEGRRPTSPPLVESVMISTASTQGVSFTSAARVLEEW